MHTLAVFECVELIDSIGEAELPDQSLNFQ
jgi:hypothetical protein